MKRFYNNLTRKTLVLFVFTVMCSLSVFAQQRKHNFNPEKFEAELEQFIAAEAALSPSESSAFLPVYREMRHKQRAFFEDGKRMRGVNPNDEKACAEAIRKCDKNDLELKKLQQTYHERFMSVLPATKVLKVIKAEDKFHRQFFNKAKGAGRPQGHKARENVNKTK